MRKKSYTHTFVDPTGEKHEITRKSHRVYTHVWAVFVRKHGAYTYGAKEIELYPGWRLAASGFSSKHVNKSPESVIGSGAVLAKPYFVCEPVQQVQE